MLTSGENGKYWHAATRTMRSTRSTNAKYWAQVEPQPPAPASIIIPAGTVIPSGTIVAGSTTVEPVSPFPNTPLPGAGGFCYYCCKHWRVDPCLACRIG